MNACACVCVCVCSRLLTAVRARNAFVGARRRTGGVKICLFGCYCSANEEYERAWMGKLVGSIID